MESLLRERENDTRFDFEQGIKGQSWKPTCPPIRFDSAIGWMETAQTRPSSIRSNIRPYFVPVRWIAKPQTRINEGSRQSLIVVRHCRLRSRAQRKADVSRKPATPRQPVFITTPDNGRHSQRFRNAAIRETKLEEASKDRFVPFFRKGFRERWEKQMSRKEERKGKGWRGNTRDYAIKSIFGWRRRVKDKITLNQAFSPIIGHPFPPGELNSFPRLPRLFTIHSWPGISRTTQIFLATISKILANFTVDRVNGDCESFPTRTRENRVAPPTFRTRNE